jgi:transcriptional regulator with XRE-family HTH domain
MASANLVERRLTYRSGAATGRGVTEVDSPEGSPTIRRRELGALLKALRTDREWTAEQVASQVGMSPSKISRLETGQRGAIARDVNALADLYGVGREERRRLLELARAGKQRSWWQPLGLPYSTYIGLETAATAISYYGLGTIPGPLQIPEYARAVVRAAIPAAEPETVEQLVQGRLTRQQLIFSDDGPRFDAVMDESVLRRVVGGPSVMRAQFQRLLELSTLPNVALRIIRFEAGALPAGNMFIILDFAQPEVPDVVYLEGLTGEAYLEDAADVEAYKTTYGTLIELAADPDATRNTIEAAMRGGAAVV